jgi:16S rRNA (uracil1498-N3)-methyltransferase
MSALRRFTIAPERIDGDRVVFDRDETRHMAAVLRLAPGDLVVAADGRGRDYTVRIESLGETATGTVLGVATNRAEPPLAITLVQGVPKGDKMELIVRAATELGVARVLPAITERTIVHLEPSRWRERARRWQRVAKEAAKQCGRAIVPEIGVPRPLAEWLEIPAGAAELKLCLWEGEGPPLARALEAVAAPPRVALVLVGPEGGLARREVELARAQGWITARLGPRILRTETAGPAIAAILQFRFGDLGGGAPAAERLRD